MKIETVGGAMIASAIGFLTGFLALMQQSTVAQVSDINENAWVVLIVGSLVSFLKDFQALRTRRAIRSMTRGSKTRSPVLIAITAALLLVFVGFGSGCTTLGVDKARLNTANKQLADKIVFVDKLVTLTRVLNAKRVITTAQAIQAHSALQKAKDTLEATKDALARNGDPSRVESVIERIDRSLAITLDLLMAVTGSTTPTDLETYDHAYHFNHS